MRLPPIELFRAAHSSTDGQEASKGEILQFAARTEEDAIAAAERTCAIRPCIVTISVVSFGDVKLYLGQHLYYPSVRIRANIRKSLLASYAEFE
jgi:hypothetical protein